MSDDRHDDNWPGYLSGPRDDLLALGVVSLNYGYLENIFRVIFAFATGFTDRQTSALFERLNNKARQDVLDQMLSSALLLPELKELVRHFSTGFAICADNRHAIMHSHHGGIHSGERGTSGIVLRKYSRSGRAYVFFAHTAALRKVADAIERQSQFGIDVFMALDRFKNSQSFGRAPFQVDTIPEKLSLPETLIWLPAQGVPPGQSLPEPSRK